MAVKIGNYTVNPSHIEHIRERAAATLGYEAIEVYPDGTLGFDQPSKSLSLGMTNLKAWYADDILSSSGFSKIRASKLDLLLSSSADLEDSLIRNPLFLTNKIEADLYVSANDSSVLRKAIPAIITGNVHLAGVQNRDLYKVFDYISGTLTLEDTSIENLYDLPPGLTGLSFNSRYITSLMGLRQSLTYINLPKSFIGNLFPLFWFRRQPTIKFDAATTAPESHQVKLFKKYWNNTRLPFGARRTQYMRAAVVAGHIPRTDILGFKPTA